MKRSNREVFSDHSESKSNPNTGDVNVKRSRKLDEPLSSDSDVEVEVDEYLSRIPDSFGDSESDGSEQTTGDTDDYDMESNTFSSADNSTSYYKTVKQTETYLDRMDLLSGGHAVSTREIFYSHLLPVFVKERLLSIYMISIPAEHLVHVIKDQGVKKLFSFENPRLFYTDNAFLLLDHRFVPNTTVTTDYVMIIVGHPMRKETLFHKELTSGAGKISLPSRRVVRLFDLSPNMCLTRAVSIKNKDLVQHRFRESVPSSFWWNTYASLVRQNDDFMLKMQEALSERTVVVDFLLLLAGVDERDNSINSIKNNTARWEPIKVKDVEERAALTIHTMLCFGFRILSFGMLCEYPKEKTKDWLKDGRKTVKRSFGKANSLVNTISSGVKRKAVMRMVYTLDTTENMSRFFKVMDKYEYVMKRRVVRSRIFYSTTIKEDTVGQCYVYPNHSLYMVVGSCNMINPTRNMGDCSALFVNGMLDELDDRQIDEYELSDSDAETGSSVKPTGVGSTKKKGKATKTVNRAVLKKHKIATSLSPGPGYIGDSSVMHDQYDDDEEKYDQDPNYESINRLKEQVKNIETALERNANLYQSNVKVLEDRLTLTQLENDEYENKVSSLRTELENERESKTLRLREKELELASESDRLRKLEAQLAEERRDNDDSEGRLKSTLIELQDKVTKHQKQLKEKESAFIQEKERLSFVQTQLDELNRQKNDGERELKRLKDELEQQRRTQEYNFKSRERQLLNEIESLRRQQEQNSVKPPSHSINNPSVHPNNRAAVSQPNTVGQAQLPQNVKQTTPPAVATGTLANNKPVQNQISNTPQKIPNTVGVPMSGTLVNDGSKQPKSPASVERTDPGTIVSPTTTGTSVNQPQKIPTTVGATAGSTSVNNGPNQNPASLDLPKPPQTETPSPPMHESVKNEANLEKRFVKSNEIPHENNWVDVSKFSVVITDEMSKAIQASVGTNNIANKYCIMKIPGSVLPPGSSLERRVKKSLQIGENQPGIAKRFARMRIILNLVRAPTMVFHDYTPVTKTNVYYDFAHDTVSDQPGCSWVDFNVNDVFLATEKLAKITKVSLLLKSDAVKKNVKPDPNKNTPNKGKGKGKGKK